MACSRASSSPRYGCSRVMLCKICGYPCLVRLLHVGIQLGDFGSVGVPRGSPTSSFAIDQLSSAQPS